MSTIISIEPSVEAKEKVLEEALRKMSPLAVAFSGGVDSAYLLAKAVDVSGPDVEAVTARSPSLPRAELEEAVELAKTLGARHRVVETRELERAGYRANGPERCYHCKAELFDTARLTVPEGRTLVDGFNADDFRDHRPGHRAALERKVAHPLADAEMTKAEIRALSRRRGLPTWDKPQMACLASRVPYGMEVTAERLARVEAVERALKRLEFRDVRARLVDGRDDWVRLEVGLAEIGRVVSPEVRPVLVEVAHEAGFRFVTLDLEGFRSGRLNEGLASGPAGLVQLGRQS